MTRRTLFLITFIFCILSLSAQDQKVKLQGNIQDAYLKCGLFDCHVSLMRKDSVSIPCKPQIFEMGTDSMHIITTYSLDIPNAAGDYILRVTKDGYDDGWANVTIPANCKNGDRIQVPLIELEKAMRSVALGEVMVKATKIKVKMRGDTLVYDATAFNLPQGSMLENLIEQLPGARMTQDGEIFINGRKIDELTLSSKSLFRGDKSVLLKNLPYFTVKELKVFERQSLQSVLSGNRDENPDYVMDVSLKNEYEYGIIANSDLAGGTKDRYSGKLFGIVLTRPLTMCVFANLNNVNDSKRAGVNSGWNDSQGYILNNANKPSTRKAAGVSISYQSEDKVAFGFPKTSFNADLNFDRYNNLNESHTYREHFLPTRTTFGRTQDNVENLITAWQSMGNFSHIPWGLSGNYALVYKEDNKDGLTHITQWDNERVTSTQNTGIKNKTREFGLSWLTFSFPIFHKLNFQLDTKWLRSENKEFNQRTSRLEESEDYRHEYGELNHTWYKFQPTLSFDQKLFNNIHLILTERYNISGDNGSDNLYVLSNLDGWKIQDSVAIDLTPSNREMIMQVFDPVNSSYSHLRQQENEFTPTLRWNKNERIPFDITLNLPFYTLNERLKYERDVVDTLAHRNMFAINPSLRLKHNKWSVLMGMKSSTPGLKNLMPYRDSRNPLNVVESNPLLKNNKRIYAEISWKHQLRSHDSSLKNSSSALLNTQFNYYQNSVAQGITYNPQTGVYTYRPENVKGNWTWNTSYQLTFPIDKNQRWWIDSETKADVWHSVDYASMSGSAQLNKVETANLREFGKLRYVGNATKASVIGDIRWRRTWGHHSAQESISAFDYRYGFTANHKLAHWGTAFDVDVCMYSRRGYVNEAMNKDECVVNASITQSLFHGKINMVLEAHDIFNQISNTAYEVNAQGRTESWYRVTLHYVMMHLIYRWNRNPKKL